MANRNSEQSSRHAASAGQRQHAAAFPGWLLPYLLIAPQLVITAVFFLWPSWQAVRQSVLREDPFGLRSQFIGLANYRRVLADPLYLEALWLTLVFSLAVVVIAMLLGLAAAIAADSLIRGGAFYETILLVPYAVAPAIAAVLWYFLMNPSIGTVTAGLSVLGITWDHNIRGDHAMILVILAAAWKQIAYNFLFFLAGLQAIPRSLLEAAIIDGAGAWSRLRHIILPLISPTTFFLAVVNLIYAVFDTFGVIHATTHGGPGQATTTLIYKVYRDGFVGLDLGGSAAQSVILMATVIVLTAIQFRYIERRVTY